MYGLIYLESPRHIGEQNLVHPNGIHITILDDEMILTERCYVAFDTLNLASGEEAIKNSLAMWKAKFREIEKYLHGVDNIIFAYRKQYAMMMSAKYMSKGYMSLKKSFEIKYDILTRNKKTISDVERSGAENAHILYSMIKKHGLDAITPVDTKVNTKKLKKKTILNKRTDVVVCNHNTGYMERQIKKILDRFGYDYTLTDGTLHLLTEVGDWKFDLTSRPVLLYRREEVSYTGIKEFKLIDNRLYSPVEAIKTVIQYDRRKLQEKLNNIDILDLEGLDEFSYLD